MKRLFISLFTFLAFTGLAQYQVGHMSINFKDASRTGGYSISGGIQMPGTGRDIGTEVYYPATTAGNNAAVATGTFPVVVIGHGFSMTWDSYDNIYNRLAAKGYIVALPRTEGSLSPSHSDFGNDLKSLAVQLVALNTVSTPTTLIGFNGKVAPTNAIGGHSMGGGCSFLSAANNTSITCLFNLAAANSNTAGVSSIQSASLVTVPTLVIGGQRDCIADTAANQNPMYNGTASSIKFKVILKDLTHCDYGNGTNFNCTFGQGTSGCSNTISNALALDRYMTYLEPFLAHQLKHDCSEGNRFMDSIQSLSSLRTGRRITGTIASALNISIAGGGASVCAGTQATLTASGANTYVWTGGITNGAAFTPTVSQNYSVTATNSVGCSKTVSTSITVNPIPTVAAVSSSSLICSGGTATLTANGATNYTWTAGPLTTSYIISPTTATTYTVIGVNAGGCSNTATITQNVSTSTISISITGQGAICSGASATLTASGATSYLWSSGISNGISFTPLATQVYTVTATNAGGCTKTSTAGIIVNPKPVITATTSSSLLCSGSSATLTAAGASNYTWTAGPSGAAYIITPSGNTVYTVTGVDANGCSNTAVITQNVSVCAGIKTLNTSNYFNVYPNPTHGSLLVSYYAVTDEPINFELFDLAGKLVYVGNAMPGSMSMNKELNIQYLDPGMYLLTVSQNNYHSSFKIIKE